MPPTKRMPLGLQARLIHTDLVAAGYESELSDIRSFMDSTLSLPENRILVANAFGYRPGARRGLPPRNLADLTTQAGLWNRQQADRRRRAAPPAGKTQTRRKRKLKTSARWQSDPWPRPGDVIDEGRKAKLPGRRVSASGKVYYERRRNRSDMPWKKV